MSIENMETLPPNGHALHAYDDGVDQYATDLARLRDALDGANGLARLLRRDSVIAGLHDSCLMDVDTALHTGTPLGEPVRSGLEAALCICVEVAWGVAHDMAQAVRDHGRAGLLRFANDRPRDAHMAKTGKGGEP